MRTTIERYFWTGKHGVLTGVTGKYTAPFYNITWTPPKGMRIDGKKLFNGALNTTYADEITKRGTVSIEYPNIKIVWDKDHDTMTFIPSGVLTNPKKVHISYYRYIMQTITDIVRARGLQPRTWRVNIIANIDTDSKKQKHHAIVLGISDDENGYKRSYIMLNKPVTVNMLDPANNTHLVDGYKEYTDYVARAFARGDKNRTSYYKAILSRKTRYDIMDLEKLGGLKIFTRSNIRSRWGIFLTRPDSGDPDNGDYVLEVISFIRYHVQEEAYDGHGSRIFKVVCFDTGQLPDGTYKIAGVRDVALIGKEYTGQWWMHNLPRFYATQSIAACERWLLNIKPEDKILVES